MNGQYRRACSDALRDIFCVPGYRPGQKEAASCLLSGRDLLCILPTGAGKSLCWQLPAVVHEGLTVVISPLIALMEDQLQGLRRRGIPAATLNSMMSREAQQEALDAIRAGEVRIVFLSPEKLMHGGLHILITMKPWLIVVDEAHCVVQWGETFRPAYKVLGEYLRNLGYRPVICAMTATADPAMQAEITRRLNMRRHRRVMLSVVRENLCYSLQTTHDSRDAVLRIVQEEPCRTVVFCRKRIATEEMAKMLRGAGVNAGYYHAGLTREQRSAVQQAFAEGRTQVLAATTAFGMGVDIPDIRCVIHADLPGSITDLAQQSGRAGRDGAQARCIILIDQEQICWLRNLMLARHVASRWVPTRHVRFMLREWRPLRRLLQLLLHGKCIQAGIAAAFGQRARPCGRCSACLNRPVPVRVPALYRIGDGDLEEWFMRWQRAALARRRGVTPGAVITGRQLKLLRRGRLPEGEVPPETVALLNRARKTRDVRSRSQEKSGLNCNIK